MGEGVESVSFDETASWYSLIIRKQRCVSFHFVQGIQMNGSQLEKAKLSVAFMRIGMGSGTQ